MKKSSIFVKDAVSGDEANLYSCCCLKHGYFRPKYPTKNVTIYIMSINFSVCPKNCTKKLQNTPPD